MINNSFKEIDLTSIFPDSNQSRKNFNIESLAKSIEKNGVVPLEVIEDNGNYKIIDGERRFRACKLLGLEKVPCIINDLDKNKIRERQLVLDFHKKHFSLLEKAKNLRKLKELNT